MKDGTNVAAWICQNLQSTYSWRDFHTVSTEALATGLENAAAHSAAAKALLRAQLQYGAKAQVARALGITNTHMSRLLSDAPYTSYDSPVRIPQALAETIAETVPFSPLERAQFMHHVERSVTLRRSVESRLVALSPSSELVEGLRSLHSSAASSADPLTAGEKYRMLMETLPRWLTDGAVRDPADLAQIHLIANDVACILQRHGDAVYHSAAAAELAENAEGDSRHLLRANAQAAAALALHNLGDDGRATALLMQPRGQAGLWDRESQIRIIKYSAGVPRTALKDIDRSIESYVERFETSVTTDEAVAFLRAYMGHPPGRRADFHIEHWFQHLLDPHQGPSDAARVVEIGETLGVVKRVILFRTAARVLHRWGDVRGYTTLISRAFRTATRAGLTDQLTLIARGVAATSR